ncbi:MAG: HDIG domain-containing metalloprotein [Candidatus Methylomirabilales bacterium]
MNRRVLGMLKSVQHHPLLWEVARVAAERGLLPVHLVGGFLRNALLGHRGTLDIDLVSVDPRALGAALQHRFAGKLICLGAQVRRVVFSRWGERVQVDIAPLRGGDIVEDLRRRDFTINALAMALGEEAPHLIDPAGGLQDLRERRIRVGDPHVLNEDPVRLLRSIRFAAQLDFRVDGETARAIRQRASLLAFAAPERLREEFFETLRCPTAGHWLSVMDALALLDTLLPETRAMRGCPQDHPHRFDVLAHAVETVRSLDGILLALPKLLPDEAASLIGPLGATVEGGIHGDALLRFVALLHDVGKPETRSMKGGRVRFLGHVERGAEMVHQIGRRLRLGSRASAMAVVLVREHLRPLSLRQVKTITPRARYRFWRDLGAWGAPLLLLSLADLRATQGREGRAFRDHLRFVREMCAFRRERMRASGQKSMGATVLDGHELMARMDLAPGAFVGFLLERLREEASLGTLTTEEEAVRYLTHHLASLREEFARGESP